MIRSLISIIWAVLVFYVLIRGFWICRKRGKFVRKMSRILKHNLGRCKYLGQIEFDKDLLRYYQETLWSFNKMYFNFWIWDFKKMVHDKKSFEEVEKFAEKSEKNVLPFKRDIKNKGEPKCQQQEKKTS